MENIDILTAGPEWLRQASCGEGVVDAIKFTSPSDEAEAAEAAATCGSCPVVLECAQFARETGQLYGVWAGVWLDRPERRRIG